MLKILIQKQQESKTHVLNSKTKSQHRTRHVYPNIKADDLSGLSWIFLNNGDEV